VSFKSTPKGLNAIDVFVVSTPLICDVLAIPTVNVVTVTATLQSAGSGESEKWQNFHFSLSRVKVNYKQSK
jgi:hypothetical protein